MNHEPLIRFDDLSVTYRGADDPALRGFDLRLEPGDSVSLVGRSGSGKSTAARAACGLLPADAAVSGRILWRGEDLLAMSPRRLRRVMGCGVAAVFQDPTGSLDPVVRVGDQIVETLRHHHGLGRTDAERRAASLLDEVRLPAALARRHPHRLSGGEQQRVALALALAGEPQLLIADEPTTALDPVVRDGIVALLRESTARRGTALVFITHDLVLARDAADRMLVLHDGSVAEGGTADGILTRPGSDAARELVAALEAPPAAAPVREGGGTALAVDGLAVPGTGDRPRLADVRFDVAQGEAFGLVGLSGAGKTTLARVLAGHLPAGGTMAPEPCRKGAPSRVQMIFQNPTAALDPRRTVLASVADAAAAAGAVDPTAEAGEWLERVGLVSGLASRRPHALSGGQRQRAVVARALAARPEVLVADEPASSLDLPARLELVDLLDECRRDFGVALILVSHDLRLVTRCCRRVGVVDAGRLVEIVSVGEEPASVSGRAIWGAGVGRSR